ncbi:MAG: hypothetical protein R3B95_12825 [Nitrospirales bacterium]|nr:hypothetical protein [Nitrospirales bacterium]
MTTGDAYVEPVNPGISEFPVDTQMFYIVFEAQPLDAPGQFAAAWFQMKDGQVTSNTPVGKDVIELEMNQRSGYFQISKPADGWNPGKYQVKIFMVHQAKRSMRSTSSARWSSRSRVNSL